jgi:DNA-binding MurR/RpiR family transcriptional regulator
MRMATLPDALAAYPDAEGFITAASPGVIGVGTSAPLAQDAAYRFRIAGVLAEAPHDVHVQHVSARLLGPGSVCVCFSHTGQTRETLGSVTAARNAGAVTIAIISFFRSPLTKLVDLVLVAGSGETDYRVEAMASRVAHTRCSTRSMSRSSLADLDC